MKKIGREVLFIGTGEGNPRNGEGSFIRLKNGAVMYGYTEFVGSSRSVPAPNFFFTSAISPMLVKDCGELTLAVFNPVTEYRTRSEAEPWGRTPYVLVVSRDRGATFDDENIFYLEDDLSNGYCYPAIIEGENYFLAAYYHSDNTEVCLNSTKIIKVMLSEIEK